MKELKKDYHLVVLDYDHNKDFEYLQSIENKEKCELLVNPVCKAKCPFGLDTPTLLEKNLQDYKEILAGKAYE